MTTETATPATAAQNIWHKIIAGVFASVMAPVMVAFGVKFSDKVLTPATPPAATAPVATAPATGSPATAATATDPAAGSVASVPAGAAAPASPAAAVNAAGPPPVGSAGASGSAIAASIPPASAAQPARALPVFKKPLSRPERLFNGRDLTGFYTYLGRPHHKGKPYGKNYDPDRVFSVEDGLLHVSGEINGVLETEKEYSDYWLTVEYKWGQKTGPVEADGAHHSAVLLNIQGPDGAVRGAFPCSFHAQLIEGASGDLFVASAPGEEHYSLTAAVEQKRVGRQTTAFYTPGAPRTTFAQGVIKRYFPGPTGQDVTGIRPAGDLERPAGEWNTLECVALNGKILVRLNDHVVNFATDVTPAAGRIGIQSHGADIFFREITLQPYNKRHDRGEQANKGEPPAN
jgi:hypothetical protein